MSYSTFITFYSNFRPKLLSDTEWNNVKDLILQKFDISIDEHADQNDNKLNEDESGWVDLEDCSNNIRSGLRVRVFIYFISYNV